MHVQRGVPSRRSISRQSQVLHDDRVHARCCDSEDVIDCRRQLVGEDQRVEREKSLDVVVVQIRTIRGSSATVKFVGAMAGVEILKAEINGVRTVGTAARIASQSPAGARSSGVQDWRDDRGSSASDTG